MQPSSPSPARAAAGERRRRLPWLQIGLATLVALLLVGVVPPMRQAASTVLSKVILFVTSPFTPPIGGLDDLPQATRVLARDGSEVGRLGAPGGGSPVPLDRLPAHVVQAVLAAEDANFYRHAGVDPPAVVRAVFNNLLGRPVQGGSTITQQLAKLNYTGSQRSFLRKAREVLFASKLEQNLSKDELLERYVNQVYFGAGAYGIGPASSAFFATTPERLNPAQAAVLAGKIRAPETLDPYARPDAVQHRRDQVLGLMRRHGWLSPADYEQALASPLQVTANRPRVGGGGRAPHFTAFVAREAATLDELGGTPESRGKRLFTGGYTVETTLDPKALDQATAAVRQLLGAPGDPTTAIVSVQPGDGAVRLLFGGLDPNLQFDVASQGRRQPGSSFKPYVYLAMLEAGIDPRSQFDSGSPRTLSCAGAPWSVRNYEGSGGGPSSVDNAMAHSINTVFAQVMARVGPEAVRKVAEKAGIAREELSPPECAMALGGLRQGVSPLEQAAGFATFAAKGVYAKPYSIVRIRDRSGDVVYEHEPETKQAIDQTHAGVLTSALQAVVTSGTGRAAAIGRPVAGKTGTTEKYGDAWFIGYVPQLATAVWVGRPEGAVPMTNVHGISVAGGTFPARLFGRYMQEVLKGVPVRPLFTASPDALNLRPPDPPPSSTSNTSSTSSTTTSTTFFPGTLPLPTYVPPTFDTLPPRLPPTPTSPRTTTTLFPPSTTTRTTFNPFGPR